MEKVLIVDDEPKVCQLICELIDWTSLDMEIVGTANDGVRALEIAEKLNPDIVITDIRMPGYDGLELIRRIKEIGNHTEIIIISGYSQFEYAKKAISYGIDEYLLKPIKKDELLRTLLKIKEKFRQRREQVSREEQLKLRILNDMEKLRSGFISDIRSESGLLADEASIEKINETYHFTFQEGCFQAVAVKIDCLARYENCLNLMKVKTVEILNRLLKPHCFDMEIFTEDSTIYCFLNFDTDNRKAIRKQFKIVLDELLVQSRLFNGLQVTLGVGSNAENITCLKDSFKSADFAIMERYVTGTGRLIEDVSYYENSSSMYSLLSQMSKSISAALDILDVKGVASVIGSAMEQMMAHQLSGQEIFRFAEEICNTYLLSMRNNQIEIPGSEHFLSGFSKAANRCGTVKELFELVESWIIRSLEDVIEEKKQEVTRPIRQAKKYIQENYMKPISLEEVSELIGFNASYFSTLFKKETGSNFTEYLTKIRMDKAKELLKETNLSISSICEQVGYMDLKHFSKSFQKIAGIKPNEYRKLYS